MKKVLIVIPTYNEAATIEACIDAVWSWTGACLKPHLLVVDDGSPDRTADRVERLKQNRYPQHISLMVRDGKRGLGTAYIDGFNWGLERGYTVLVEMDADLSHHPRYLCPMIRQLDRCDFVVGSRYVEGGGIDGWDSIRKLVSRLGSLYARWILNLRIHDLTGGFNVWRSEVLRGIDLSSILSQGYSFQIELKYRAVAKGFQWREFPIVFADRRLGKSKMSQRIVLEAIHRVWQLKLDRRIR